MPSCTRLAIPGLDLRGFAPGWSPSPAWLYHASLSHTCSRRSLPRAGNTIRWRVRLVPRPITLPLWCYTQAVSSACTCKGTSSQRMATPGRGSRQLWWGFEQGSRAQETSQQGLNLRLSIHHGPDYGRDELPIIPRSCLMQRSLYNSRYLRLLAGQQRPKPACAGSVGEPGIRGVAYPRSCVYELEKPMLRMLTHI